MISQHNDEIPVIFDFMPQNSIIVGLNICVVHFSHKLWFKILRFSTLNPHFFNSPNHDILNSVSFKLSLSFQE